MILVLDTNVLVAGVRSPLGASAELIRMASRRQITLVTSIALYFEYEAVLKRPQHLQAAGLAEHDIDDLLDAMATFIQPVETYFLWRPRLRDSDDDMVLEVAANGSADAIVTFNVRDFALAYHEFGIPVLLPGAALRKIRDDH